MGDETKARDEICEVGLSLFSRGLTFGSTGNISVRLPDGGWLMTPTNASLGKLDPANLSKFDSENRLVSGGKPTKEAFLHFCMYKERADARAVVHLHSTHSVAVSLLADVDPRDALPPLTAYFVMRVGRLPLAPYFPPGDESLAKAVGALAGEHHAVLLANHGPVVAGTSLGKRPICDRGARGDGEALPHAARPGHQAADAGGSQRPARALQSALTAPVLSARKRHKPVLRSARYSRDTSDGVFMDVFSRVVEQIGAAAIVLRGQDGRKVTQAFGGNPTIPPAKPQGSIPTLKMPTARGWSPGQAPNPAPGLKVNAFATDLKHPRWICVLPNGDVLTAEALTTPDPVKLALRLRHVQHPETGGGHGRQPEPHHAFARRRSRRRRGDEEHVPRAAKPAVRHGARRRYVLRRQYRRRRRLSLYSGRERASPNRAAS